MTLTCKLDKIFTWILGICFVLFILTGFDVQQRLLTPQLSSLLHIRWIVLPALVAFGYHTVYKSYIKICTCERYARVKKVLLVIYAVFVAAMIVYYTYYQFIV